MLRLSTKTRLRTRMQPLLLPSLPFNAPTWGAQISPISTPIVTTFYGFRHQSFTAWYVTKLEQGSLTVNLLSDAVKQANARFIPCIIAHAEASPLVLALRCVFLQVARFSYASFVYYVSIRLFGSLFCVCTMVRFLREVELVRTLLSITSTSQEKTREIGYLLYIRKKLLPDRPKRKF